MKRALGIISVVMACSTMFAQAIIQSCQLQSAILGQSVNVCTTPGSFTFFETITANVQGGGTATTAGTGNDGVSLEVIDVTWGSGAISVSSSPANTWTPGTMQTHGAVKHQQFYCISPATDPAVATFSVTGTGDTVFHVNMFTSTGTPTFVGESGGGASSSATFQPGNTSPATAIQNGLFITGLGAVDSLVGIDSGFSTPADASLSGFSDSTSFKISGGAENPTWTCSLPNAGSVTMMLFSPGCAPASGSPLVLTETLGSPRTDAQAGVGISFTAQSAVTIISLGRWVYSGNSGSHVVSLMDASGTVLTSATVSTSGATTGQFAYSSCTHFTLTIGTQYFIVSAENGDQWGDTSGVTCDTSVTGSGGAAWSSAVVIGGVPFTATFTESYVPVSALFTP